MKFEQLKANISSNKKAIAGGLWVVFGSASQQGIRLISNLILTRLLFPEAFGLISIAFAVLATLNMLSDIGINISIIHHKKGETQDFLNTAWTLQIIRGFGIWAIAAALAHPISVFYNEPLLAYIVACLGASSAILGFRTTSFALQNRRLNLGKVTGIEVGAQLIGTLVMICLSWMYASVWALVAGALVTSVVNVASGHVWLSEFRHKLAIDKEAFKDIFGFGKWIFVSTVLGIIATQGDKFIVGKYLSIAELGLYTLAISLCKIPQTLQVTLGDRILMPMYSEMHRNSDANIKLKVYNVRVVLNTGFLAVMIFLMICGPFLVSLLYDDRYAQAGVMIQILSVGIAVVVATSVGPYFLSQGQKKTFTFLVFVDVASMLLCVYVGAKLYGKTGILLGIPLAQIIYSVIQAAVLAKHNMWFWRQDLLFLMAIAAAVTISLTGPLGTCLSSISTCF